ncbi:hypothetical protein T484DRAFT_1919227 [Baffinella frigidus]|nr:hypothetical protein T484DRAFT_1919227 [Cryptophyta sp. CCMP2293]
MGTVLMRGDPSGTVVGPTMVFHGEGGGAAGGDESIAGPTMVFKDDAAGTVVFHKAEAVRDSGTVVMLPAKSGSGGVGGTAVTPTGGQARVYPVKTEVGGDLPGGAGAGVSVYALSNECSERFQGVLEAGALSNEVSALELVEIEDLEAAEALLLGPDQATNGMSLASEAELERRLLLLQGQLQAKVMALQKLFEEKARMLRLAHHKANSSSGSDFH